MLSTAQLFSPVNADQTKLTPTLNSMNASVLPPGAVFGFGEGMRNCKLSKPSSSIRNEVLVELCNARRVRAI